MFCPKCGQPQASDEVRFCVRCGLQLDGVKELLSPNIPTVPIYQQQILQPVSKWQKPGVKTGAKLIFLSCILAPICFALAVGVADNPAPLMIPFTVFLIGFFWLIYSYLFGESPISKTQIPAIQDANTAIHHFPQYQTPQALPPQSINTAEMVRPPSVTENTTKLFEKK